MRRISKNVVTAIETRVGHMDKQFLEDLNNGESTLAVVGLGYVGMLQGGIFGFHGSCGYLPYGRSPLNWSIMCSSFHIGNFFKRKKNEFEIK